MVVTLYISMLLLGQIFSHLLCYSIEVAGLHIKLFHVVVLHFLIQRLVFLAVDCDERACRSRRYPVGTKLKMKHLSPELTTRLRHLLEKPASGSHAFQR